MKAPNVAGEPRADATVYDAAAFRRARLDVGLFAVRTSAASTSARTPGRHDSLSVHADRR
ncbi:MAG TPA: hypothetical protein VFC00_06110 [Micromonosporaceae bacterium]|nr:hypothetical protein [Micromonosporaceae bacterium]